MRDAGFSVARVEAASVVAAFKAAVVLDSRRDGACRDGNLGAILLCAKDGPLGLPEVRQDAVARRARDKESGQRPDSRVFMEQLASFTGNRFDPSGGYGGTL
ncbi:MAG: hypothetical protein KJ749_06020 [Planctomycetes bacterium]|nr:hypothetical protein [Planctomycetota bacterium]